MTFSALGAQSSLSNDDESHDKSSETEGHSSSLDRVNKTTLLISNQKSRTISGTCSGFLLTRLRRKDNQLNGLVYGKTKDIF